MTSVTLLTIIVAGSAGHAFMLTFRAALFGRVPQHDFFIIPILIFVVFTLSVFGRSFAPQAIAVDQVSQHMEQLGVEFHGHVNKSGAIATVPEDVTMPVIIENGHAMTLFGAVHYVACVNERPYEGEFKELFWCDPEQPEREQRSLLR